MAFLIDRRSFIYVAIYQKSCQGGTVNKDLHFSFKEMRFFMAGYGMKKLLRIISLLLFGSVCRGCSCPSFEVVCCRCKESFSNSVLGNQAAFLDYGVVRGLVREAKYGTWRGGAKWISRCAVKRLLREYDLSSVDMVICVPCVSKRVRKRGVDLPNVFAKELSNALCVPRIQILKRIGSSTQKGLSIKERAKNARSSFVLKKRKVATRAFYRSMHENAGGVVLLVDDVRTTGSTLSRCAALVKSEATRLGKKCSVHTLSIVSVPEYRGHRP